MTESEMKRLCEQENLSEASLAKLLSLGLLEEFLRADGTVAIRATDAGQSAIATKH